jgi:hypothetical protein
MHHGTRAWDGLNLTTPRSGPRQAWVDGASETCPGGQPAVSCEDPKTPSGQVFSTLRRRGVRREPGTRELLACRSGAQGAAWPWDLVSGIINRRCWVAPRKPSGEASGRTTWRRGLHGATRRAGARFASHVASGSSQTAPDLLVARGSLDTKIPRGKTPAMFERPRLELAREGVRRLGKLGEDSWRSVTGE